MIRTTIFNGKAYTLKGTELKVGDTAPNFTVVNNELEYVNFYDLPRGVQIISCCTSINSPMCDLQNRRLNAEVYICTRDVTAFTISVDLPFAQQRYSFEEDIEHLTFLSDYKNLDFGYQYGVVIEELRLLSRAIFVVDEDYTIHHVEYVKDNEDQFNYLKAIAITKQLQKI